MFGDDAVGISWVKTAAKDGFKANGLIQRMASGPTLHQEPAEGAQEGGGAVGLVAGGVPDLTEDSEVGREMQNQSGRGTWGAQKGLFGHATALGRPVATLWW